MIITFISAIHGEWSRSCDGVSIAPFVWNILIARHWVVNSRILDLRHRPAGDENGFGVNSMLIRERTQPGARAPMAAAVRGFAVILREADFRDAMLFHGALCRMNYHAYLVGMSRRMALARQAGLRVLIGPFLVDQHVSFADRLGLAPFGTLALRRYDDFVTQTCPQTRVWRGDPLHLPASELRAAAEAAIAPGRAPPRQRPRSHDVSTAN